MKDKWEILKEKIREVLRLLEEKEKEKEKLKEEVAFLKRRVEDLERKNLEIEVLKKRMEHLENERGLVREKVKSLLKTLREVSS